MTYQEYADLLQQRFRARQVILDLKAKKDPEKWRTLDASSTVLTTVFLKRHIADIEATPGFQEWANRSHAKE